MPKPHRRPSWTILTVCLVAAAFGLGSTQDAPETSSSPAVLASFQLEDQFGAAHRVSFPGERPTILLVGDQHGSEEVGGWIPPLAEQLGDQAQILGIADVRGVPGLFRNSIRKLMRKRHAHPVLLDFEGTVLEALPCTRRTANVFVIDAGGHVLARVIGPVSDDRLREVRQALPTANEGAVGAIQPPTSARASAAKGVLK